MGSDVAVRQTLDLTRAPDEQWNDEMVRLVTNQLFRGQEVTKGQVYYSLAIAESIGLNPLLGEIYFIPAKSRDGMGPSLQPYIGRNGLVKKARERSTYFESDTVHENDKFRMYRKRDGTVELTHSYGAKDRGEIVGAYAFLHDEMGRRRPAFFYAELDQYLPKFDADWKMEKSSWGNQRSAMIEKCAMIAAGRKRLDLGNVLSDGELAIVDQMREAGPPLPPPVEEVGVFEFGAFTDDPGLAERLRLAAEVAGWAPAKCELVFTGMSDEELAAKAAELEAAAGDVSRSPEPDAPDDEPYAGVPDGQGGAGSAGEGGVGEGEGVTDAEVVPDEEHAEALRRRAADLERRLQGAPPDSDEFSALSAELDQVESELSAVENPDQDSLL